MDSETRSPRRKVANRPAARLADTKSPTTDAPAEIDMGELAQHLGYALRRAQLRIFDSFIAVVAPLKLTPAQFSVLLLLDKNPGRNQTEIAASLGILRPNFVVLLNALEVRGLCNRTRSPQDRRSHVLVLTDKGRAMLHDANRLIAKHNRALATVLTATERADLIEMLNRLARLV